MSVAREGRLPAPFENVLFKFSIDWSARLKYLGPLDELARAGVITEDMRGQLFRRNAGKKSVTASGDHFWAHRKATKSDPTRAEIIFSVDAADRALLLPGVADEFPDGIQLKPSNQYRQDIWDSFPRLRSVHDAEAAEAASVHGRGLASGQQRSRTVGRFQRLARWSVSEKLIVVDWAGMARERIEAQAR